ncbi:hypothetical protein [Actinomadura madurae]|nr:hypothetical protein [Actinomadura madurae]
MTGRLITLAPPPAFDGTINDWLWSDTVPLGMYATPTTLPTAA